MKPNLPHRPTAPTNLADDKAVAEYKAALRAWDRKVIESKALSIREVNARNAAFPRKPKTQFKILNFEEALLSQR